MASLESRCVTPNGLTFMHGGRCGASKNRAEMHHGSVDVSLRFVLDRQLKKGARIGSGRVARLFIWWCLCSGETVMGDRLCDMSRPEYGGGMMQMQPSGYKSELRSQSPQPSPPVCWQQRAGTAPVVGNLKGEMAGEEEKQSEQPTDMPLRGH